MGKLVGIVVGTSDRLWHSNRSIRAAIHCARRATLIFCTIILIGIGLQTDRAYAAELTGPPDAQGNHAYCNIGQNPKTMAPGATANVVTTAACQYGPTTTTVAMILVSLNSQYGTNYINLVGSCNGESCTTTKNTGGQVVATSNWGSVSYANGITWSTATCTMYLTSNPSIGRQCNVKTFTANTMTTADVPSDYWPGGSPGTVADLTMPEATCSRVLSQNNGANVGTFTGGPNAPTNMTFAYGWNFGDGVTQVARNPQHTYPSLSTMPAGGWTATLTINASASAGHAFTNGSTTATKTCALRVDFLNPSQTTPSSTEVDAPEDSDCPTGFGWLNPLAIAKILKCLFIPSEDSIDSLKDLWGESITEKAPFSWAYQAIAFVPGFFLETAGEVEDYYTPCRSHLIRGEMSPSGQSNIVKFPGTGPNGIDLNTSDVLASSDCATNSGLFGAGDWLTLLRKIQLFMFTCVLALSIYRTTVWTIS